MEATTTQGTTTTTTTPARKAHGEVITHRGALKIFRIALPSGGGLPEHPAADDLIIVGVRGNGTIYVEQEVRHVAPGEVLEVRRGERHSVEADADEELDLVVIQGPQPPL